MIRGCGGLVDFAVVAVVVGTAGRQLPSLRRMWPPSAWAEAGVDRTELALVVSAAAYWEATEKEGKVIL